jgi:hypothetical protein
MLMKCGCEFVAVGKPFDLSKCGGGHTVPYRCDECKNCSEYKPSRVPGNHVDWPKCICGHIAHEHNTSVS